MIEASQNVLDEALASFGGSQPTFVDGVWVNESVRGRDFKYYIFDWDDNIVYMPTRIHLERFNEDENRWVPHLVSTSLFSAIRNDTKHYRPPNNDWDMAFVEFRDSILQGGCRFLDDTRKAFSAIAENRKKPGPSFNAFKKTLIEGRLFAIVTARGHAPEVLQHGVKLFIDTVLTPVEREIMLINLRGYRYCFDGCRTFPSRTSDLNYYLSLNQYHAVTSPIFNQRLRDASLTLATQEDRKRFAIKDFVNHVIHIIEKTGGDTLRRPISVGFSDDDPENVAAVKNFIQEELHKYFPSVKFCVYDASQPEFGTQKIMVTGQIEMDFQ